jgi:hypothetical protein
MHKHDNVKANRVVLDGREIETEAKKRRESQMVARPVSMTKMKKSAKTYDENDPFIVQPMSREQINPPKRIPDIVIPSALQTALRQPSPRDEQSASVMKLTAHPSAKTNHEKQESVMTASTEEYRLSIGWEQKREAMQRNTIARNRRFLLQKRVVRRWKLFTKNRIAEKFYRFCTLRNTLRQIKQRYDQLRLEWKHHVVTEAKHMFYLRERYFKQWAKRLQEVHAEDDRKFDMACRFAFNKCMSNAFQHWKQYIATRSTKKEELEDADSLYRLLLIRRVFTHMKDKKQMTRAIMYHEYRLKAKGLEAFSQTILRKQRNQADEKQSQLFYRQLLWKRWYTRYHELQVRVFT